jgi:alanine racemase
MRLNSSLYVDFEILKENFKKLNSLAPDNKIIFMVKGDAYGHGLIPISKFVENESLTNSFGVASLGEAQALRSGGIKSKVFVFSDCEVLSELAAYEKLNLIPVLSSLAQVRAFLAFKSSNIPLVLKFNTGMNRLGLDIDELEILIAELKKSSVKTISHLMTHFSNSYFKIKKNDKTQRQYEIFKKIKKELESHFEILDSSVSNSGAIEQKFGLEETHIRPGLMLYGPASVGAYKNVERLWTGEIISRFESNILSIRKVIKGDPVGYGGVVVPENGTILTVPVGYADGFLTYYAGLKIKLKDKDLKVHGRINMDLTSFFSTENASSFLVGERIEFWNHTQDSMTDFYTQAKTIPYQVFTAITTRIPRIYSDK